MKKYVVFVLVPSVCIVVLINLVVPNPSRDDPKEYIYKAYASGNYETVEREYRSLLRDDFYNLKYHRGYIFSHYEIPKRAGSDNPRDDYEILAYYTKLSNSSDPNVADIAYYCLGLINTEELKYEAALVFFLKVGNRSLNYLNNSIGHCHLELGDYERAKASFKREIEAEGNVRSAVNNYAEVLLRQQDIKEFEHILNNTKYKDLIRPYIKKRFYYASRNFISYVLLIASSYKENVILEGLISAVLICIVWLLFIRGLDIFEPEQFRFLFLTLLISIVFCELSSHLLYDFFSYDLHFRLEGSLLSELAYCIFGIGLIEESVKLVPVLIILLLTRQVNESTDFIVYASISALGFAFQENLGYFDRFGLSSIGGRAITSTLLHMALSSFAIYGLLLSKYRKKPAYYFAISFFVACTIHGLYDLPLVTTSWLSDLSVLSFAIFVFSIIAYKGVFVNALNNSEFFKKTDYATSIRRNGLTLVYGLSYIIVVNTSAKFLTLY